MRHARSVTLALSVFLLPAGLSAQTIPSPFTFVETRHSVQAFVGQLVTNPGSLDLGPQSAFTIGGRYTIRLTGPLSGEVGLSFSPTQRTLLTRPSPQPEAPLVPLGEADMVLMIGEAGLRFNFPGARTWRGLMPYAVLTGGFVADLTRQDPREEAIPAEQRFKFGPGFAAGGAMGTEFFVTERLSLRAEARDHLWRTTHPALLTPTGSQQSEWGHNFAFTLGGAVHF